MKSEQRKSSTLRKALPGLRKKAGVSLLELARMAKLSESSLSRFETGKRGLSRAARDRVVEAIYEILSGKTARDKLSALRESEAAKELKKAIPLRSLGRSEDPFDFVAEAETLKREYEAVEAERDFLRRTLEREMVMSDLYFKAMRDVLSEEKRAAVNSRVDSLYKKPAFKDQIAAVNARIDAGLARSRADELRERISAKERADQP